MELTPGSNSLDYEPSVLFNNLSPARQRDVYVEVMGKVYGHLCTYPSISVSNLEDFVQQGFEYMVKHKPLEYLIGEGGYRSIVALCIRGSYFAISEWARNQAKIDIVSNPDQLERRNRRGQAEDDVTSSVFGSSQTCDAEDLSQNTYSQILNSLKRVIENKRFQEGGYSQARREALLRFVSISYSEPERFFTVANSEFLRLRPGAARSLSARLSCTENYVSKLHAEIEAVRRACISILTTEP